MTPNPLSILFESYCNDEGAIVQAFASDYFQFSSSLIATQKRTFMWTRILFFQFSSSLIATFLHLANTSLLFCTTFQFSSSLIATFNSDNRKFSYCCLSILFESYCNLIILSARRMRATSFQFSSSLIATTAGPTRGRKGRQLSILFESYCNRADFPSVRPTGSCTFLYI